MQERARQRDASVHIQKIYLNSRRLPSAREKLSAGFVPVSSSVV
jgi:hypothetical protein